MAHFSKLLTKYAEWRVLRLLLEGGPPMHVNEVARRAGVSRGTASKSLDFLGRAGLATFEQIGNVKRFSLTDSVLVRELKVLANLARLDEIGLVKRFLDEDPSIASIVLYGSFADGSFDKRSDVDLLVVSNAQKDFSGTIKKLEEGLGREVTLLRYRTSGLIRARKDDAVFYENLRLNHRILYGSGLP